MPEDIGVTAVIVDIVRSRQLSDRRATQHRIAASFAAINDETEPIDPLAATIGDEFQASYPDVDAALYATLLIRLAMPEETDCRVGIGRGEVRAVGTGIAGALQDGPGWWRARAAIETAHAQEDSTVPLARSWYREDDGEADSLMQRAINAYLLARDQVVGSMSARDRRLCLGVLRGRSQKELAAEAGVSQSAVSQALRRSGAASVIVGARQFERAGT